MPIQLNYTDPDSGINIPASYWFILRANIDQINNVIQFDLGGFITLAAKNAGKKPQKQVTIVTTFAALGMSASNTLAQIATALYTFALTYNDGTGVFFTGGTIV